ncbi:aldo/keto reductase family protein [Ruminococcus albus]|uniref:Aldo/keto reductase n=1 Tax=Ruminococcus albus TaxID=1264 RepID=A0A1H7NAY6_RUMAL|nr:aldo/keto reductase [Ruminococcus albus]SEL20650.1 Aldo/keto reductase [Ruminococcus albus]
MIYRESYTLSNGNTIPKIALGTWQTSNEDAERVVRHALDIGYLHIDTAIAYGNEVGVGKGMKASGKTRDSYFVTSKLPAEIKTYEEAVRHINESLERLDTSYLDLMLIHWPRPWDGDPNNNYNKENLAVWKAFEEAYEAGKLKAIGVSNFSVEDLQNLMDNAKIKPMVNQIRVHIGHVPTELIEFCKKNDILVESYSPNATGRLSAKKEISEMAEKYGVSVSQLANRFDLQLGTLPLPKSVHEEFIKQNTELDFIISDDDMQKLLAIKE